MKIIDILLESKLLSSKSEVRRMLQQNAVYVNGERITDEDFLIYGGNETIIKVGKRKFLKVK